MNDYFFPVLFLVPEFDGLSIVQDDVCLAKRRWGTSLFDLATLATRHTLHLPYQVMDVFLARCNSELCVKQQASLADAIMRLRSLKMALYASGVSPFVTPFATSHSINDYSGINDRGVETLRARLPLEMQEGITSETVKVEAWPLDLSFQCIALADSLKVTEDVFTISCDKAIIWSEMVGSSDTIRGFSDAVLSTVMMNSLSQSILHMWCAIESLFPTVGAELSFRISLYLSQLVSQGAERLAYFENVKKNYNTRSRIAHGAIHEASMGDWTAAWTIVTDTFNALIRKRAHPSEEALLGELLS
jgi:hypothetical protein